MTAREDILRAMAGEVWGLDRSALEQLVVTGAFDDLRVAAVERAKMAAAASSGDTAVIPVMGTLTRRASWFTDLFGGATTDRIRGALSAAVADKRVERIILWVDSPGGSIGGIPELAAAIRATRARKPVVAVVEGYAASAGYWIASQADTIIASQSSYLGSIGVYTLHLGISRMLDKAGVDVAYIVAPGPAKVEGHPEIGLTAEARAYEQGIIDGIYVDFINDVALGRGVPRSRVRAEYGGGRIVDARQAVSLGMADRIGTLADVLGWGNHSFESERRAIAGLRPPTYAMERARRRAMSTERTHR